MGTNIINKSIKEKQEKDNSRRDKLAGYFFDLSKLVFAALVLGGLTPIFADVDAHISWGTVLMGVLSTFFLAFFANRILK